MFPVWSPYQFVWPVFKGHLICNFLEICKLCFLRNTKWSTLSACNFFPVEYHDEFKIVWYCMHIWQPPYAISSPGQFIWPVFQDDFLSHFVQFSALSLLHLLSGYFHELIICTLSNSRSNWTFHGFLCTSRYLCPRFGDLRRSFDIFSKGILWSPHIDFIRFKCCQRHLINFND